MDKKLLTKGSIPKGLLLLSLPIMATSFMQMAYNLTDLFWISKLGSGAVASVGIAGFYTWLSMGVALLTKIGTEILTAQRTGGGDEKSAQTVARTGLIASAVSALIYSAVVFIFRVPLITFFRTGNMSVEQDAITFLVIMVVGYIFTFLNLQFTGLFNARGNSSIPFKANGVGLIINIILDPLLIYGYGFFPAMGIVGAGIATVFAQAVVTTFFLILVFYKKKLFSDLEISAKVDFKVLREMVKLGTFPAIQSIMFTLIAIAIGRIISSFGPTPIAVQKIGSQIESISWMTANGLGTALIAMIGQNKGAGEYRRMYHAYQVGLLAAIALGITTTAILFFGNRFFFTLFIPEPEAILQGGDYLAILAYSQLFMCIEISSNGILYGLGETKFAATNSILFNLLRIPMAYYLSMNALGVNGIWWAISISSVLKGLVITTHLFLKMRAYKQYAN